MENKIVFFGWGWLEENFFEDYQEVVRTSGDDELSDKLDELNEEISEEFLDTFGRESTHLEDMLILEWFQSKW